jgi:hypothetical protein
MFRAGPAVSCETSRTGAEGLGLQTVGEKLLGLPLRFLARHGFRVAWAGIEGHPPEPPGLDSVTALLGQNGKVPQGEVSVDVLINATEVVGTLERRENGTRGGKTARHCYRLFARGSSLGYRHVNA